MAFDLNNFVIDRIVRGVALSQKDDSVLFSINQIQNASLNCASESTDAVDSIGVPIATFYRAKSAEFSAENALFDMNLMATQLGTSKKVASSTSKILAPAMETFTVAAGAMTYLNVLAAAPLKCGYCDMFSITSSTIGMTFSGFISIKWPISSLPLSS